MPLLRLESFEINMLADICASRSYGIFSISSLKALAARLGLECFEDVLIKDHDSDHTLTVAGKVFVVDIVIHIPIHAESRAKALDVKLQIADQNGHHQALEAKFLSSLTANKDTVFLDEFAELLKRISMIDRLSRLPEINWFARLKLIHETLSKFTTAEACVNQSKYGFAMPKSLDCKYWISHENIPDYPHQEFSFSLGVLEAEEFKMSLQMDWMNLTTYEWMEASERDSNVGLVLYMDHPVLMTEYAISELEKTAQVACHGRTVLYLEEALCNETCRTIKRNSDSVTYEYIFNIECLNIHPIEARFVKRIVIDHPKELEILIDRLRKAIVFWMLISSLKKPSFSVQKLKDIGNSLDQKMQTDVYRNDVSTVVELNIKTLLENEFLTFEIENARFCVYSTDEYPYINLKYVEDNQDFSELKKAWEILSKTQDLAAFVIRYIFK